MSLDQDDLKEDHEKKHHADGEAPVIQRDIVEKELEFIAQTARAKQEMNLPLSEKERLALKTDKVVKGLSQKRQQQKQ